MLRTVRSSATALVASLLLLSANAAAGSGRYGGHGSYGYYGPSPGSGYYGGPVSPHPPPNHGPLDVFELDLGYTSFDAQAFDQGLPEFTAGLSALTWESLEAIEWDVARGTPNRRRLKAISAQDWDAVATFRIPTDHAASVVQLLSAASIDGDLGELLLVLGGRLGRIWWSIQRADGTRMSSGELDVPPPPSAGPSPSTAPSPSPAATDASPSLAPSPTEDSPEDAPAPAPLNAESLDNLTISLPPLEGIPTQTTDAWSPSPAPAPAQAPALSTDGTATLSGAAVGGADTAKKSNLGAILGGAIGGGLGAVCLAGLVTYLVMRRRKQGGSLSSGGAMYVANPAYKESGVTATLSSAAGKAGSERFELAEVVEATGTPRSARRRHATPFNEQQQG